MWSVTKEVQFDAGHRVPDHKSKCRNPHGHRYKVECQIMADELIDKGSSKGMVIDFGDIKRIMVEEVHDVLDHGFIVYEGDKDMMNALGYAVMPEPFLVTTGRDWKVIIFPYVPTAENIARWVWEKVSPRLKDRYVNDCMLVLVRVWETPTSVATYWEEETEHGQAHDHE